MDITPENKKQIATILLAVGMGLVAVFLTSQHIKNSIQNQTAVLSREYQKQNKKSQSINQQLAGELERMQKAIGTLNKQQKVLATQQKKALEAKKVVKKKDVPIPAFSVKTPPGKRAITVMLESLSAVGGLISSGDYVDVIAKLNLPKVEGDKDAPKTATSVLFQNVPVLAVGTKFEGKITNATYATQQKSKMLNITLALTPEEAGLLAFAQGNGKLKLALRSPVEQERSFLKVASWETLSDYLLHEQGTELIIPKGKKSKSGIIDEGEEVQPVIQIFRGGREL